MTNIERHLIETAVRLVELKREARADVGKDTTATERGLACFRVLEACVVAYEAEQRKASAS